MITTSFLLYASIGCIFVAFVMFVWGFVPDEVEEDDIYGYRLTRRKRLIEENELYALSLPAIQVFAHYFRSVPDHRSERMASMRRT